MARILLLENPHSSADNVFAKADHEIIRMDSALQGQELIDALQGVQMLGIRSKTNVTREVLEACPDLVDRIFDYLLEEFPQLAGDTARLKKAEAAVRAEFAGSEVYLQKRSSRDLAAEVLRLFNGRNATEVARRLGVSKRTVYRYLKQPGRE